MQDPGEPAIEAVLGIVEVIQPAALEPDRVEPGHRKSLGQFRQGVLADGACSKLKTAQPPISSTTNSTILNTEWRPTEKSMTSSSPTINRYADDAQRFPLMIS